MPLADGGRSGTGRFGVKYFYYVCRGEDCGLRVAADEVEGAVLGRISALAQDETLVERLVVETNARLQRQAPATQKRKRALQRDLDEVKGDADKAIHEWSAIGEEGRSFLTDRLGELGQRRVDIERGLTEVEEALRRTKEQIIGVEAVRHALCQLSDVYDQLKPFERKELVRLVLHRAEVGDRQMILEIRGNAFAMPAKTSLQSGSRFETPSWLPDEDSNLEPSG